MLCDEGVSVNWKWLTQKDENDTGKPHQAVFIQAPKNMGKSRDFVDHCLIPFIANISLCLCRLVIPLANSSANVLTVAHRQSLCQDLARRLEAQLYEHGFREEHNNVVVCVNSLTMSEITKRK